MNSYNIITVQKFVIGETRILCKCHSVFTVHRSCLYLNIKNSWQVLFTTIFNLSVSHFTKIAIKTHFISRSFRTQGDLYLWDGNKGWWSLGRLFVFLLLMTFVNVQTQ